MNKRTIAKLPTDRRVPGLVAPFRDALCCENRTPRAKTASVPVMRGDAYTLACTGSWPLAGAFVKAVLT